MDSGKSQGTDDFIPWDRYIYVLDFLQQSNHTILSLLGGEPTLHPDFAEMFEYGMLRGFGMRVFTGGTMPESQQDRLIELSRRHDAQVNFIVNINEPRHATDKETALQHSFVAKGGSRVSLGFNIFEEQFDLSFLFDLIATHSLAPTIRLGLTHPIWPQKKNRYIEPGRYRAIAARLESFFPLFEKHRVAPSLDCGFPVCMFTDAQLGKMAKLGTVHNWTCGPIFDIGPDLSVWPCFPLSRFSESSLYDFSSIDEVREHLRSRVNACLGDRKGIFEHCAECAYRETVKCSGGCRSYLLEVPS